MLFKPEMIKAIVYGTKTQTRRPVRGGHLYISRDDNGVVINKSVYRHVLNETNDVIDTRLMYRTGRTYAIQPGRGKPQVARLKLLNISREKVDEISLIDAKEEGFQSIDEFFSIWQFLYGKNWRKTHNECFVFEFELHKIVDQKYIDDLLAAMNNYKVG